jgi:predicted dehydrogenase
VQSTPACVVVGSGSAGRRHAATLRALLPDHRLVLVRRPRSRQPTAPFDEMGAIIVTSISEALVYRPALGVVAGPATTHAADCTVLLSEGVHVLVEKPLAASSADGCRIHAASILGGLPVVVGYHLRLDDVAASFAEGVWAEAAISETRSFELSVGQHLGEWRSTPAPERSVSARFELGGGVLLELSHEIDAVLRMFGPVVSVRAQLASDGAPTDGVVDTVADLELVMASGATGRVHLDMVSRPAHRTWTAEGLGWRVAADLREGTVRIGSGPRQRNITVPSGSRDRAEERLIQNLLHVSTGAAQPVCTSGEGLAVLAVIDAARASADTGAAVRVATPAISPPTSIEKGTNS